MIWRVPKGKCCGKVIAINYGRFNNDWMKKFIKRITSRMQTAITTTLQAISSDELLEQICFPKELT